MIASPGSGEHGGLGLLSRLLLFVIRAYQLFLSPLLRNLLGSGCRFHPSCSEYAVESIHIHGAWRGVSLTFGRLSRCHPFHPGGYDPPVSRS